MQIIVQLQTFSYGKISVKKEKYIAFYHNVFNQINNQYLI